MSVRVVGAVAADELARLGAIDRLATLEDVLAWCRVHAAEIIDVVVQDEYSHDVIVRAPAVYVCFDTT